MILAGLVATPAMAADQFDLVCKGRQKTSISGAWKPYEQRYRVDVAAKTYCRYDCKAVESVKSVDAARIEFEASDRSEPGNVALIHYVDRSDGKWVYLFSGGSSSFESVEGVCEPAPFTGLPATRF
jgi:hypothetical protein